MLSMSVEHANQLRQLIVEKHRPQPAGLANVYSLIIIYYSQCTIRQPKVIFLHMPAGKHKKNLFHETASACHRFGKSAGLVSGAPLHMGGRALISSF